MLEINKAALVMGVRGLGGGRVYAEFMPHLFAVSKFYDGILLLFDEWVFPSCFLNIFCLGFEA